MGRERALESSTSNPEQSQSDAHVVVQAHQIPAVVFDGQLRALLGISRDTYARRKRRGDYGFLLLQPQPSGRTQYCGARVARWLSGENLSPAVAVSRFFGKGRAAAQDVERRTRGARRSDERVAMREVR
jgi:hypothetical protein